MDWGPTRTHDDWEFGDPCQEYEDIYPDFDYSSLRLIHIAKRVDGKLVCSTGEAKRKVRKQLREGERIVDWSSSIHTYAFRVAK